jgi:hypothetical protein
MQGPINVKSPNNTSKWQMGFNSAFKGLNRSEGHIWPIENNVAVFVYSQVTSGRGLSFRYIAVTWFGIRPFHLGFVDGKVVLKQMLLRVDSSVFLYQWHSTNALYLLISSVTDPK